MIVSAYYKIPSKASHDFYVENMKRWFRSIKSQVVFFTTDDIKHEIESWNISLDHVTFVMLTFPWKKGYEFWKRQKQRDIEAYHTPELGAIWYAKKEFVLHAIKLFPEERVFIWCDAGCIRNLNSELAARNGFGTRMIDDLDDGTLHLQKIRNIEMKTYYTYPDITIAGAIMAGNKTAWESHSSLYDHVLCDYDNNDICCNSDQYITQSCADRYPNRYTMHTPMKVDDEWFFFLWIL